jgi:hypothetical protein
MSDTVMLHWSANSISQADEEEDSGIPVAEWKQMTDDEKEAVLMDWVHERVSMWTEPE